MNLADTAGLLENQVIQALDSLTEAKELKIILFEQLAHDGRGVGVENDPHLPFLLLPITICQALGGNPTSAIQAAAAFQLFMTAADILDDIEDNDNAVSICARYGAAKANNAATTLIFLAEKGLVKLNDSVDAATVNRIVDIANSNFLRACAGQHLDLSIPPGISVSESRYLKITALKSAAPIENICHIGAVLGAARPPIVARFAKFGYYLGMSGQMSNDIKGVKNLNDILARKATLPLIFALKFGDRNTRKTLADYLQESAISKSGAEEISRLLVKCGAVQYALILAESYKVQAQEQLQRINQSGIPIQQLEILFK